MNLPAVQQRTLLLSSDERCDMRRKATHKRSAFLKHSVLSICAGLMVGCQSGGSSGSSENPDVIPLETDLDPLIIEQPALQWRTCEEAPSLECATVMVPMDYSKPNGLTIDIAMARSAADPLTQQRTLLLNPGGPGGGGIDLLRSLADYAQIPDSIDSTFDFIGFDPRGIGKSTPVECDTDALYRQDIYPTSRSEIQQVLSLASEFAKDCFNKEGEYLQHLGSYNVVRDMNEMRKALGLSEFDFLGYSYGTRLAALYMQTFPQSTGRFVLDGSMTPDPTLSPLVSGGLLPAQANIETLASACLGLTMLCDPREFMDDLQNKVDEVGAGPNTAEAYLLFGILQFASTVPGFEQLLIGSLATYLETGDVESLEFIFEFLGLGEALEDQGVFNYTAYISVLCADDPGRPTIESLEALQDSYNAESDLFAELYLYSSTGACVGWPESVDPIPQIATNQAPASLVIGGPTDAQTPLIFSELMAEAVGGHFLYSDHDGHTTTFSGDNQCTETAVENFLLSGTLPATGRCEALGPVASAERWQTPVVRPVVALGGR